MTTTRNKSIIPANKIRIGQQKLMVTEQQNQPPRVTVNREGELIRTIEVRCGCGEHLVLDCIYEPSGEFTS